MSGPEDETAAKMKCFRKRLNSGSRREKQIFLKDVNYVMILRGTGGTEIRLKESQCSLFYCFFFFPSETTNFQSNKFDFGEYVHYKISSVSKYFISSFLALTLNVLKSKI